LYALRGNAWVNAPAFRYAQRTCMDSHAEHGNQVNFNFIAGLIFRDTLLSEPDRIDFQL